MCKNIKNACLVKLTIWIIYTKISTKKLFKTLIKTILLQVVFNTCKKSIFKLT